MLIETDTKYAFSTSTCIKRRMDSQHVDKMKRDVYGYPGDDNPFLDLPRISRDFSSKIAFVFVVTRLDLKEELC